jgi:hypothetical protein
MQNLKYLLQSCIVSVDPAIPSRGKGGKKGAIIMELQVQNAMGAVKNLAGKMWHFAD